MRNYVLLFFTFFSLMSFAQAPKGFTSIKDIADFKKKFTIKSDFTQEKNLSVLSEKIKSKGVFMFMKQNRTRMEYTSPFKYLLVINGDKVFIKDEQKSNSFSSYSSRLVLVLTLT